MKNIKILIIGIIITIAIDYISSTYGNLINLNIDFIPNSFGKHSIIFFLSIVAIYLFKKHVNYRIEIPKFKTLLKPIGIGLLVSLLTGMIMSAVMVMSSGNNTSGIKMPTSSLSVTQVILFVFIYSSIAEEILFRGFLLNILKPLKNIGISIFKRKISLAVTISAVMFGLYHIIPFNSHSSLLYAVAMFTSPLILGLVAGYYQEKYDNNFYAIVVHMAGNLMGIIGTIAMNANA